MSRYKEERRRQLASQVASRLSRSSAASSSEEEEREADKLSYTEYKRRRRQRENKAVTGSGQDLSASSRRSKLSSQSLRSSESCLPRLRGSPEHIYQSIGSDLGVSTVTTATSRHRTTKTDNHDSGRSISPPTRRLFSREGSVESSGQIGIILVTFPPQKSQVLIHKGGGGKGQSGPDFFTRISLTQ